MTRAEPPATSTHGRAADHAERVAFVDAYEARLGPLLKTRALASWELSTTGSAEARDALRAALHAIDAAHDDASVTGQVARWAKNPSGDAEIDRCMQLIHNEYLPRSVDRALLRSINDLQTQLAQTFSVFRPEVNGERWAADRVEDVLSRATDATQRRIAWEAAHAVGGEVAEGIRELVRLRNRAATSLGYRNWYALSLELQELSESKLTALFERLDRTTREPFAQRKAVLDGRLARSYGVPAEGLEPWHYADPFFQRLPDAGSVDLDGFYRSVDLVEAASRFFDGLGMNTRPILERSDLLPREGKSQHAFCTHIDRAGDVRILCNLTPSGRWATTLLHELGHGVYDRYLGASLRHTLRKPAHICVTEAIAMLMGRAASEPEFLQVFAEAQAAEIQPLVGELRRHQAMAMLLFVRWSLVMFEFERALYADPDRVDLNALWWELRSRYQLVRTPTGRNAPDWAAKIHLATAPVYYHNYVLGELTASQLRAKIAGESRSASLVDNLEGGELLIREVFARGASLRWDALLEAATGETLQPGYFVREFVTAERVA